MAERLLLLAESDADLQTISALTQDMAVRSADVAWQPKARRFVMIGNRYRWEAREKTRVRSGLRFDAVLAARRRNWPRGDAVLALLAIRKDGDHLRLDFAGGASIELHVEAVDVVLEDLTGVWGAKTTPDHG
jgi:Protein of unknown function (DUF2948)